MTLLVLSLHNLELNLVHQVLVVQLLQLVNEFAGVVTATSFVGSGANLTGVISGVELESEGNSVALQLQILLLDLILLLHLQRVSP